MMKQHFQAELLSLRDQLSELGRQVAENVNKAVNALLNADAGDSAAVLHAEHHVDFAEVRIEEECLKVIALHQPVADDLRFLAGMIHIDHELERIGDLAAALAKRVGEVAGDVLPPYVDGLRALAVLARDMTENSLRAMLDRDVGLARDVWVRDDEVDSLHKELTDRLHADILAQTDDDRSRFELLGATDDIERMADHAANIAKAVIYQILGRIVRHRGREFRIHGLGGIIRVLFVCVHNSARSQMAAAWLNRLHGDCYEAESAGLTPGDPNPLAVEVMREAGIDIAGNRPRDVFDVARSDKGFDYVVTVCDAVSAERCPPVLGIAEQIQWEFEDPSAFDGSREERLEKTRYVRDAIRAKIDEWVRVAASGCSAFESVERGG
jgi:phosphate transport system regulatory protein PhoU